MSPSVDYAYLKTLISQGPSRSRPGDSINCGASRPSSKQEPTVNLPTPPTTYDGDDELSEVTGSSKSSSPQLAPKNDVSPSQIPDSRSQKPHQTESLEHSPTDETKSHRSSSPVVNEPTPNISIDTICAGEADGHCTLGSGDYRKVTSHIFGRNKRCTNQIPEDCWIKYCRKHYQRQKYRCPSDWFETQLLLIDGQLDKMEAWGGITSWTIAIRKKERTMLDQENSFLAQNRRMPDGPLCRERFLLPYLGSNKTFEEVRDLIDVINRECDSTHTFQLPSFELLPDIDERRHPRPRRGPVRRIRKPSTPVPVAPETFRLLTDGTGQLKTETLRQSDVKNKKSKSDNATTARRPSPAAAVSAYAPTAPLPTTKHNTPRSLKRSFANFDGDNELVTADGQPPGKRFHRSRSI
ncbi:MAG: hypothetical protein Q9222_004909 [Ikaeria aurantiellina]